MSIEAMKQIADIAEGSTTANSLQHIAKIARQAIAEAEKQEPVAMYREKCADGSRCLHGCHTNEPCYTHQQPKADQSMVEHLSTVAGYFYDGPVRNLSVVDACEKAINKISGKEIYKTSIVQQTKLEDIEQYRLQMAGISTAAIGYWKEGDRIHPDYDTVALRDVAKLYAKYAELYDAQPKAEQINSTTSMSSTSQNGAQPKAEQEPKREWVGLTDEEINDLVDNTGYKDYLDLVERTEAKLKENNGL